MVLGVKYVFYIFNGLVMLNPLHFTPVNSHWSSYYTLYRTVFIYKAIIFKALTAYYCAFPTSSQIPLVRHTFSVTFDSMVEHVTLFCHCATVASCKYCNTVDYRVIISCSSPDGCATLFLNHNQHRTKG